MLRICLLILLLITGLTDRALAGRNTCIRNDLSGPSRQGPEKFNSWFEAGIAVQQRSIEARHPGASSSIAELQSLGRPLRDSKSQEISLDVVSEAVQKREMQIQGIKNISKDFAEGSPEKRIFDQGVDKMEELLAPVRKMLINKRQAGQEFSSAELNIIESQTRKIQAEIAELRVGSRISDVMFHGTTAGLLPGGEKLTAKFARKEFDFIAMDEAGKMIWIEVKNYKDVMGLKHPHWEKIVNQARLTVKIAEALGVKPGLQIYFTRGLSKSAEEFLRKTFGYEVFGAIRDGQAL